MNRMNRITLVFFLLILLQLYVLDFHQRPRQIHQEFLRLQFLRLFLHLRHFHHLHH